MIELAKRAFSEGDGGDFEYRAIERYKSAFIPWLEGWIAVAEDQTTGLRIEWLRYGANRNEVAASAHSVLARLAARHPELGTYVASDIAPTVANFVSGNGENWRRQISPRGQDRMWRAMSSAVKDLLALRP